MSPFNMEWNGERFRCYVDGKNGKRLRISLLQEEIVIELLDGENTVASEKATYEDIETSLEP